MTRPTIYIALNDPELSKTLGTAAPAWNVHHRHDSLQIIKLLQHQVPDALICEINLSGCGGILIFDWLAIRSISLRWAVLLASTRPSHKTLNQIADLQLRCRFHLYVLDKQPQLFSELRPLLEA